MSLRLKFALAMVALAGAATVAVGAVSYASTAERLRREVDGSLVVAAQRLAAPGRAGRFDLPVRGAGQLVYQVIDARGVVREQDPDAELPVGEVDRRVAAATPGTFVLHDGRADGERLRILTIAVPGGAVQVARSLEETERVLASIRGRSVLIILVTVAAAAAVGAVVAQTVTRRLVRLTDAASAVASSGELDVSVPVDGDDETGRLGRAFQGMLESLARSRRAQHQLVQDAGHELRTPLTSLRTNVSVLHRFDELPPQARRQLVDDLEIETRELSRMVDEIVQLATDGRDDEPPVPVALADVATAVADRARRRSGRGVRVDADATVVVVRRQAVERAVSNLVENALKFSDGDVVVRVEAGRVSVDDGGPGIAASDRDRVFDRFYRADAARALPGSGLGLAIVRQVAEQHGGGVFVGERPGGGATVGLWLPVAPPPPAR